MYAKFEEVVSNNICSGCGGCAYAKPEKIYIKEDKYGQLKATIKEPLNNIEKEILNKICPFSSQSLDRNFDKINSLVGNYIGAYAGYVCEEDFRNNGSSGGFGTWIFKELLVSGLIDAVVHVKAVDRGDNLFEYNISNNIFELKEGSSSKYYPITLVEVLNVIKASNKSFAVIAIPCFVRTLRNLQELDEDLKNNIKFVGSLYCGHLKTKDYSYYIADSIKYEHGRMTSINYRLKAENEKSSNYKTSITTSEGYYEEFRQNIKGTNWGLGLFKYKSCDYCEDVAGDLADFSLGDAWLPKYEKDDLGYNLVIVRSKLIMNIIEDAYNDKKIHLEKVTDEDLYAAQGGGYRHKREGIYVRNKLLKFRYGVQVKVRHSSTERPSYKKQLLYLYRVFLREFSKVYAIAKRNKVTFKLFEIAVGTLAKLHGGLVRYCK